MKNRADEKFLINTDNFKKINFQLANLIKPPKHIYNIIVNKNSLNLKYKSFKSRADNNINNNMINFARKIIIKNINKYNANNSQIGLNIIQNFIEDKAAHKKVILKEYNKFNNNTEYLKGFYKHKEIIKIFPKFYIYYKNYFQFFLKPTLSDFKFNDLLKKNGDNQAKYFYETYINNKNDLTKNRNQLGFRYNKKVLGTNILEKNNNHSSINISNEIINNTKQKNSDFSSISLLSIINLINNKNTSLNKLDEENDFLKKKINLFLDNKKDNNLNNKSQKSTTVLTPKNNHNLKIINNYQNNQDFRKTKPKIRNILNNYNNIKSIFQNNNDNIGIICLSERNNIGQNYKSNFQNLKSDIQLKSKNNNSNVNDKKTKKITNNSNFDTSNNNVYNMKKSSYSPMNPKLYQMSNKISKFKLINTSRNGYNPFLNQTQIKKIINKSPTFRKDAFKNKTNRITAKNIKYNNSTNINNVHNNTLKLYHRNRNDYVNNTFIYYQKIKRENLAEQK